MLDSLLPPTRQGILAILFMNPERAWYASEIAQILNVPRSSLQRELRLLTEVGILRSYRKGRMVYFQANDDAPIFPELRGLLLKTAGLVDVVARALAGLAGKICAAFIYGSMASGNARADSDVDLLLIGKAKPADLALPLREARERLGRDVNPKVYTPQEFAEKRAAKDHFLMRILGKPKLFVIGSNRELAEITG